MKKAMRVKGHGATVEAEEINGYEVLITPKKKSYPGIAFKDPKNGMWVVIDERTGMSFGPHSNTKKGAVQEAEDRILRCESIKYFENLLKSQPSVEENLAKAKDAKKELRRKQELAAKLGKTLGFKLPPCGYAAMSGNFSINVIALDRMLRVPDGTSTKQHIINLYGTEVAEQINSLI